MEKVEKLYSDYLLGKLSLHDLQCQLEPALGDFDFISKEDEQFIKTVANELELIIHTVPEESQKEKVVELFPKVFDHLRKKQN